MPTSLAALTMEMSLGLAGQADTEARPGEEEKEKQVGESGQAFVLGGEKLPQVEEGVRSNVRTRFNLQQCHASGWAAFEPI